MAPRRVLPILSLVLVAACLACEGTDAERPVGPAGDVTALAFGANGGLAERSDPSARAAAVVPSADRSHEAAAQFAFAPTTFRAEMSGKTVLVRLIRTGDDLVGSVLDDTRARPLRGHVDATGEIELRDDRGGVYSGLIGDEGVSGQGPDGSRFWLQPRFRDVPAEVRLTASLRVIPKVRHERKDGASIVVIQPVLDGEGANVDSVNIGLGEVIDPAEDPSPREPEQAADGEGEEMAAEEIDVSYEAHALGGGLVSVAVSSYVYTGGAHGLTSVRCFVADPATGVVVHPRDALEPSRLDALGALVTARFRAENEGAPLTRVGFFDDTIRLSQATEVCPTEGGVRVTFQAYEIAPYAFGRPSVTLSRAEAAPFFRGAALPGRPPARALGTKPAAPWFL